ncbi:MAG: flotillin-like FloA family protein [Planctomycetota bacterium]|jgi:uncharacterized protein YqfA (UPF0365 family)
MSDSTKTLLILAAIMAVLIANVVVLKYGMLWIRARISGAPVSLFQLMGMSLRKVPAMLIVNNHILARKAGLKLGVSDLEVHYLAGGHVNEVVMALVAASKANVPLDFMMACAFDLAGRDVVDAVRTAVHPKIIPVPDPFEGTEVVRIRTADGDQIFMRAALTVSTCLERLIGGANEEMIARRAGELLIERVSRMDAEDVPESVGELESAAMQGGLDEGTAFNLLSVDISVKRD